MTKQKKFKYTKEMIERLKQIAKIVIVVPKKENKKTLDKQI